MHRTAEEVVNAGRSEGMEYNDVKTNLMVEKWFSNVPAHVLDDIAGSEELLKKLKEELKYQGVEFQKIKEILQLKKSSTYFFYGVSGSGVGYMARAFARELVNTGMMYMEAKGSELLSKYVGEGEKNIALLFQNAKNREPVVLVIDEVEQICANRSEVPMSQYLFGLTNTFLSEYHAIQSSNVTVIAISNQPWNVDNCLVDHAKCFRVDAPDSAMEEQERVKEFEKNTLLL